MSDLSYEILRPGERPSARAGERFAERFGAVDWSSREASLRRLDVLARVLDTAIAVPGTNIRFGLDAVIGLVPGIGDLITTVSSAYLIVEARRLGLPKTAMLRMLGNVAVDTAIGWIPLVGDAFDVFWRANRRNMRILREHLERPPRR